MPRDSSLHTGPQDRITPMGRTGPPGGSKIFPATPQTGRTRPNFAPQISRGAWPQGQDGGQRPPSGPRPLDGAEARPAPRSKTPRPVSPPRRPCEIRGPQQPPDRTSP